MTNEAKLLLLKESIEQLEIYDVLGMIADASPDAGVAQAIRLCQTSLKESNLRLLNLIED